MLVGDEQGGGDHLVDVAEAVGDQGDQVVALLGEVGRDASVEREVAVVEFHHAVHVAHTHQVFLLLVLGQRQGRHRPPHGVLLHHVLAADHLHLAVQSSREQEVPVVAQGSHLLVVVHVQVAHQLDLGQS